MGLDDLRTKLRLVERWVVRRAALAAGEWSPGLPEGFRVLRHECRHHEVLPAGAAGGSERHAPHAAIDPVVIASLLGSRAPSAVPAVRLGELIFLDVETTGLSAGPACQVFLAGIGAVDGERLVTEQYLLNHPRSEADMLAALLPRLAAARGVVTFNGRTFDWPVLSARTLHLGLPPLPDPPLHLDLLLPARRIWRLRTGSAALPVLEASVLGRRRPAPLPGWLIPSMYADYLESGDARLLDPVVEHNRHDVLALPALLDAARRALREPAGAEFALDLYSVGRVHEVAGTAEHARVAYAAALARGVEAPHRVRAAARLSRLYAREGRAEDAVRLWEEEIGGPLRGSAQARVALAKLYEHHRRDYAAAHRAATEALDLAAEEPDPLRRRLVEELVRRLDRLDRRMTARPARPAAPGHAGRNRSG
ncbi:MAG: ribonuclease H-like domain-containing protein [Armatimonadetes bacterium]|nr:ribonuclease H-like domain-containing protein [Armatimonadota bacterium]